MFFGKTGVDEQTMAILSYSGHRMAYGASSIRTRLTNDAWIYGTLGKIHIPNFIWAHGAELLLNDSERKDIFTPENFVSNGYNYEAEEVMRCIREGKTASEVMPWDESLTIMETMDRIRAQWDFKYPSEIEAVA
jgi:predicted dehydrogenase